MDKGHQPSPIARRDPQARSVVADGDQSALATNRIGSPNGKTEQRPSLKPDVIIDHVHHDAADLRVPDRIDDDLSMPPGAINKNAHKIPPVLFYLAIAPATMAMRRGVLRTTSTIRSRFPTVN